MRLPHGEGIELPAYETAGAAGWTCARRCRKTAHSTFCQATRAGADRAGPGNCRWLRGPGAAALGLAAKHGITVLNTPGTVDSDYRGEVKVLLINQGDTEFVVTPGMRIAQMVFAAVAQMVLNKRTAVSETSRGGGGYGSTGIA